MKLKHLMLAACMSALGVAFADVILPSGDKTGATDTAAIQAALDAAAAESPAGTVTLGEGLFEVNAHLNLSGGVTLTGQGRDKTVIRFAGTKAGSDYRVANISGGSVLSHVTLTGGKNNKNESSGGGANISGGTISWCCITNNYAQRGYGGGVYVTGSSSVKIDHTIISKNSAGEAFYNKHGGGIGIRAETGVKSLSVEIDSCLISGNVVGGSGRTSSGGGIGIDSRGYITLVVRNTTIVGNRVVGSGVGGGLYDMQDTKGSTTLINCILADNTSEAEGDGNLMFSTDAVKGKCSASNCLFGNGTTGFGTNPVCVEGSAGFVAPAAGDYHLLATSPAVGKGTVYAGIGKDLDGSDFANPPSVGCYELESQQPPAFGTVTVTPSAKEATISGTVASLGSWASACDVYLAYGPSAETLGASAKIAEGVTDAFAHTLSKLKGSTTYFYELYVTNNATPAMGAKTNGSFTTTVDPGFRRKVTFTVGYDAEGAEDLSGIPVLVKLSAGNPVGFKYSDCAADGSDIRFFDANGAAVPFEIDTWDTTGDSLIWVKAPSIAQGTTFTMFYKGNPKGTLAEPTDPQAVWTAYTGVWHLNGLGADTTQYSQGLYANATATADIDAHLSANSIPNETGKFGKAFRTNDSTGKKKDNWNEGGAWVVDAGTDSPIDSDNGKLTVSCWVKHNDWGNAGGEKIIYKRMDSDNKVSPVNAFAVEAQSKYYDFAFTAKPSKDARARDETSGKDPEPRSDWVYVTAVYDSSNTVLIYVNADKRGGKDSIAGVTDNDAPLVFGNNVAIADGATGDSAWNGWIDEVRFSKSAKSAKWIAAEYAAMTDDTFVTAGEVEKTDEGFILIVR